MSDETTPPTPDEATPIRPIPLELIDEGALPRDRTVLDAAALIELRLSIAASGLRMPIEVFPHPYDPDRYGLLSGYRRLHAFRALLDLTGQERYAAIPAFVRPAADRATLLAAVVEENEIRADLSPWERGNILTGAVRMEIFATVDEAVDRLYPNADRNKRRRLRLLALLVEELDGELVDPESLSLRQCLRLANALTRDFGEVIRVALAETERDATPETQWQVLQPLLREAETTDPIEAGTAAVSRPGRPRRNLTPRRGLNIRRERTNDGYCLHFTGRLATSSLIDTVFDHVEMLFSPA
jgi:ParB family chromosome partitioning protein